MEEKRYLYEGINGREYEMRMSSPRAIKALLDLIDPRVESFVCNDNRCTFEIPGVLADGFPVFIRELLIEDGENILAFDDELRKNLTFGTIVKLLDDVEAALKPDNLLEMLAAATGATVALLDRERDAERRARREQSWNDAA